MRYLISLALILILGTNTYGQKFISTSSNVHFFSSAPLEDIEATNKTARSVIDLTNGDLAFIIKVKDFQFEKSLMQEHFNENYLESEKYPEARFLGKLNNWTKKEGSQNISATGEFEIHGIKQKAEVKGTINYANDQVSIESVFVIQLKDYKVKIPKAVFYNIAEKVEVTVNFDYELVKS